jgi:hypothetical protein
MQDRHACMSREAGCMHLDGKTSINVFIMDMLVLTILLSVDTIQIVL